MNPLAWGVVGIVFAIMLFDDWRGGKPIKFKKRKK